jgi:hypothetical protein
LTAEDLASEADPDGDGVANDEDDDDDGDGVPDEQDRCVTTFIGAERVTDDGCLIGDVTGAVDEEGNQVPDGCVNGDDVAAVNFFQVLMDDGLGALSSLIWGLFDNWNAGEGNC